MPEPSLGSLSTRAGTDGVGHAIRSLTDANKAASVVDRRHRSIRPCPQERHDGEIIGGAKSQRIGAFCPFHQRSTDKLHLDRFRRHPTSNPPGRRRRAGGSLDAPALQLGNPRRFEGSGFTSGIWTTSVWSHLPNVHVQCTICLATTCSQWLAPSFTQARLMSGIELASAMMKWRILARRSGVQEESKSWPVRPGSG